MTYGDLRVGERMLIWRRRVGLSRRAAIQALTDTWRAQQGARPGQSPRDVLLKRNWHWLARVERGEEDMAPADLPWTGSRTLTDAERCLVHRRRAKVTQSWVAEKVGMSRLWVNKMERGTEDCGALLALWER